MIIFSVPEGKGGEPVELVISQYNLTDRLIT
jgi:hypothetical protein